jgi:hypothetical protein
MHAQAVAQQIAELFERTLRNRGVAAYQSDQRVISIENEVRIELAAHRLERGLRAQRLRLRRSRHAGERAVDQHVVQHAERHDAPVDLHRAAEEERVEADEAEPSRSGEDDERDHQRDMRTEASDPARHSQHRDADERVGEEIGDGVADGEADWDPVREQRGGVNRHQRDPRGRIHPFGARYGAWIDCA